MITRLIAAGDAASTKRRPRRKARLLSNAAVTCAALLAILSPSPFLHAEPPGQTYFDSTVGHVPWTLSRKAYSAFRGHHKFGTVFWRGQLLVVHAEIFNLPSAGNPKSLQVYRIDSSLFKTNASPAKITELELAPLVSSARNQGTVEYGPDYTTIIQAEIFDDKLFVFYYYQNEICYNVYTPPSGTVLAGGNWSQRRIVPGTGLARTTTGPFVVDDFAVSETALVSPDGDVTPTLVLACALNHDTQPIAGDASSAAQRRVIRFFTSSDGGSWKTAAAHVYDRASDGKSFKTRCIDLDLTPIVDETGRMPLAMAACIRADNSRASADSQALLGIFDGVALSNLSDLRKQFDNPNFAPFRMRLFWGTLANSEAEFNGRPLPSARNVLQVFMTDNPSPQGSGAIHRAEVFLGEPGYRADGRPLTLLRLNASPNGGTALKETTFASLPASWAPSSHVVSAYWAFWPGDKRSSFFNGFAQPIRKESFEYDDGPFDVVSIVNQEGSGDTVHLQQQALLIGYRGSGSFSVGDRLYSVLAMKSDQLVPYGYKDTSKGPVEMRQVASDRFSLSGTDYFRSWHLVGIINGLPPYDDTVRRAAPPDFKGEVVSKIETTTAESKQIQVTGEATSVIGFTAGFNAGIAKVDGSWKETSLLSEATKTTIGTSQGITFQSSSLLSPGRGFMLILAPIITTQTYYQSAWDGERLNYRHAFVPSGNGAPSAPIAFVRTSVTEVEAQIAMYAIDNPNSPSTPYAHGLPPFPLSTDLEGWRYQAQMIPPPTNSTYHSIATLGALTPNYRLGGSVFSKIEQQTTTTRKTSTTVEVEAKAGITFGKTLTAGLNYNSKHTHTLELTTIRTFTLGLTITPPPYEVSGLPGHHPESWTVQPYFLEPAPEPNSKDKYKNSFFIPTAYADRNMSPFFLTYRVNRISYPNAASPIPAMRTFASAAEAADTPPPLEFVSVPQSAAVARGASASLSADVTPDEDIDYQWFFDFEPLAGAESATLEIDDFGPDKEGCYYVRATDGNGESVYSPAAYLDNIDPPEIRIHPLALAAPSYSAAEFFVVADGAESYQWRIDGEPVEGATTDTFALETLPQNTAAPLIVDVLVSNSTTSIASDPAELRIFSPVDLDDTPSQMGFLEGNDPVFSASGHLPEGSTFWWFLGDLLVGTTSAPTLSITDIPVDWHGRTLSVAVLGENGDWDTADIATFAIRALPPIYKLPEHVSFQRRPMAPDKPYVFRVAADKSLSYQWFHGRNRFANGRGVRGASSHRLVLSGPEPDFRGAISVRIRDKEGNTRIIRSKTLPLRRRSS